MNATGRLLKRAVRGTVVSAHKFAWTNAHRFRGVGIGARLAVKGRYDALGSVQIGSGSMLESDILLWVSPERRAGQALIIGRDSFVGRNCYIGVYERITIGDHVQIGAYSYIISANHVFERRDVPIQRQGYTGRPIEIENDVWIGAHAVVLPGARLGRGAIIAAGSVVNAEVPPYEIWGGVPARFLKQRPG